LALSPARPDRPILFAHQDAKRLLVQAELDRAIADQFAVKLDRDGLVAVHAQSPGLEIFNLRDVNVGTKYHILEIFNDLELAEPLEDDDVQQTVVDHCLFKKWKWAAIEPPVADKDE
jgi:hypothetical protein